MSFWSQFPGPHWRDCVESLNPCASPQFGIYEEALAIQPRRCNLARGFHFVSLDSKHAKVLETFLRTHFSIYPRCKISLTERRIEQGFFLDNWIGVGVFTIDKKLVGCCVSKPLGRLKLTHEILPESGVVDYFCIHKDYRKQGLASSMLEEYVKVTARQKRFVHIFLKEGFPLLKLPPLYTSQYIARKKGNPDDTKECIGAMGIGLHSHIKNYTHADYLPLTKFVANLPYQLTGDSHLFSFNQKGHSIFLCVTNLHHRTVPEGFTIGELSWMLPQTAEVPLSIQKLAVETCVNSCPFDIVLMDTKIPHETHRGWQKDAAYSWYIFNYNPGTFFTTKPYFIF